ncbi:MAG: DUF933 domain-containing protein [Candidatus Omnitrophica bacterium]|nr:DUF933 domain-containing protein [Candidatus Omnitrophota bacterium]
MKIANFGLDIQPGKYKYRCECFDKLVEKFAPAKVTPFTVEFIGDEYEKADSVVFDETRRFDFVFLDLEKIEKRLERGCEDKEKSLLIRAQKLLEEEKLLCDLKEEFSEEERTLLRNLSFVSYKPSLAAQSGEVDKELIRKILEKAEIILFFTAGKKEVHAWDVKAGSSIVEAAGRIHSDLARGFIKAEIATCGGLDSFYNMAEARAKGLVTLVGKEYFIQAGDIIEVKFNV